MTEFTQRVLEIIRAIPPGRVKTYGQIAREAGSPRGARQVVRILSAMSAKHQLPWQRVVNAKGEINQQEPGRSLQIQLLRSEGVVVVGNKVSLRDFQAFGGD